jgi:hypothetical protein
MNIVTKVKIDTKIMLSTLWIVVMLNVVMADIFGFGLASMSGQQTQEFQATQVQMLIFAMIMEIPIAMIFLSRILKRGVNRWANIIASVVTIAFVIIGGSAKLHYYFFGAVEIGCMLLIVLRSWKWPELIAETLEEKG